jgi:hypothetical protein
MRSWLVALLEKSLMTNQPLRELPVLAVPKPPKKEKRQPSSLLRTGIKRGGRKPKDSGRRQEREFANKYEEFTRVVGSGAFGNFDPMLKGDLKGIIGRKPFLLEMKSWATVNALGEKTINIPLSVLDKVRIEGETEGRYAGVVFHPKGTSRYIAIFDWDDFYAIFKEQEEYILRLEVELDG